MQKRALAEFLCTGFRVPKRRACQVLAFARSCYYYRHHADPQVELRVRLKDLAGARVRYGYRRLHVLLLREGWQINHKRVYRLYKQEGLSLRLKTKKKRGERAACSNACAKRTTAMLEHGLCGGSAGGWTTVSALNISG